MGESQGFPRHGERVQKDRIIAYSMQCGGLRLTASLKRWFVCETLDPGARTFNSSARSRASLCPRLCAREKLLFFGQSSTIDIVGSSS